MIYATERDARLGRSIGSTAMWRQSGSTGVREVKAGTIEFGTAIATVMIDLENGYQHFGTNINGVIPLPFQIATTSKLPDSKFTTPAEMVECLRESFGLNVTQLACVLHIERITVYAWLRTKLMEKLNASNRDRLWRLYQLAKNWREYAPLSGKYLLEPIPGMDSTLLQLLSGTEIKQSVFADAYEALARASGPGTRAQRHRIEQRLALKKGIDNLRKNVDKSGMDLS